MFKDLGEDIPDVEVGILLFPIPEAEVRFDFDRTALNGWGIFDGLDETELIFDWAWGFPEEGLGIRLCDALETVLLEPIIGLTIDDDFPFVELKACGG